MHQYCGARTEEKRRDNISFSHDKTSSVNNNYLIYKVTSQLKGNTTQTKNHHNTPRKIQWLGLGCGMCFVPR